MMTAEEKLKEEEEVIEIDEDGHIYPMGEAPTRKPSILRDPEGEY